MKLIFYAVLSYTYDWPQFLRKINQNTPNFYILRNGMPYAWVTF
jgi:hypothetical protein